MSERSSRSPRIVAIGGGTGLSTMLRGLKHFSSNITAVVSMADNGGGSGVLRQELGMPPPGDVRNCLQALANTEPTMEALLAHRFRDGNLRGQSFGNLFLAALNEMSGSFDEAVARMSEVLAITGRVLPVTNEKVDLVADFDDGATVVGQIQIAGYTPAVKGCLEALEKADLILLGPGSLYTSVLPNLVVEGISEAIRSSRGAKVYIMNLMTQEGETAGYTAYDHVRALFDHGGDALFDHCLINDLPVPPAALELYRREGSAPISVDVTALARMGVRADFAPVADFAHGLVRHDPMALARAIMDLYHRISPTRIY